MESTISCLRFVPISHCREVSDTSLNNVSIATIYELHTDTHTHMYAQSRVWHAQYTAQLLLCYSLACTN